MEGETAGTERSSGFISVSGGAGGEGVDQPFMRSSSVMMERGASVGVAI